MPANLCLWDCQHNLHADKNMIQYCQCRIALSNDIVEKKWNSTPAEERSIFITVGCAEFKVTHWNTFNAFFSCIKWIKSEWMSYFWLPQTVEKQIAFLPPKYLGSQNSWQNYIYYAFGKLSVSQKSKVVPGTQLQRCFQTKRQWHLHQPRRKSWHCGPRLVTWPQISYQIQGYKRFS